MQPVFLMIGGVMTGLAIGRREIILLAMGVMASGIGWFNPDGRSALPAPIVLAAAVMAGFILSRAFPRRRRQRRSYGTSSSDSYVSSSWSDSSTSTTSSDSGWFGGGESGGGGSGGGDSGGGSSD